MSISKNQLKIITSLSQKKYRIQHQLFIAEGVKVVHELLHSSFELESIFATEDFVCDDFDDKLIRISETDLKKISFLKTPNKVVALFKIPVKKSIQKNGLIVVLDGINDPGNLGTIIRLCDWFGISQLICSTDTVDCFNPKVVQASMGSLTRISIDYLDLEPYLTQTKLPIFMADMKGENVYQKNLPKEAILLMGNEANGVSPAIKKYANQVISIPRFGEIQQTESLNVATATAILLSEFKRVQ
ncbi:MAG: RNA methyltransferase [Flavobacteriia bacterium]|nr:RNA methyltransferase [Flavobacteriia bacterium]OIP45964.1 MAG: RNA methyltransferase [Flavobacteriaceae bacterium CG2_30_31_66]PIV95896.1 MAG: RNA methyltransferase [Flavobacteriaceae bacterium CG17_big_fil_post_rev_8_21_14_2_50_31_13]PIX14340.1 MAG: RNA methyltransferase [Flavobacteriaceae bacterium CG_4_8_14_3_um_filter_31_8]PIY15381.1 MAG: RNA methyltransferase [Flavobacteriaceae bacterium CG_4_10_14_3_um_filter_31_253]PIZ11148.1 MAG: RNA methyltransferase [Flavobacteriaceae bacterium C